MMDEDDSGLTGALAVPPSHELLLASAQSDGEVNEHAAAAQLHRLTGRSPSMGSAHSADGGSFYRRFRGRGYVPPPREQEWYQAGFILVAELVGTGVLALPHTFAVIGPASGLVLLFVFSLLSFYSGILLYRLQTWYPQGITYGDMAFEVGGFHAQQVVFGFIYIAFFGNLAIYILTCAEALQTMLYDLKDACKWYYTIVTVLFLLPFCQLRRLHHISFVAGASGLAIFLALILILVVTFTSEDHDTRPDGEDENNRTFLKCMSSITTAIFAFGGQGIFFETMAEQKNPDEFPKALKVSTSIILLVYVVVSLSCYSVYGDAVKGNVLYSLENGFAKRIAAFLLFFHVCISYVLAQQVIGRAIHVRVSPDDVDANTTRERVQWFCISGSILVLSFFIANGVPFFKNLMGFVGALSTAPLTFGVPAVMVLVADKTLPKDSSKPRLGRLEFALLIFFIIISVYLIIVGCISNTNELIHQWNHIGAPFACHSING